MVGKVVQDVMTQCWEINAEAFHIHSFIGHTVPQNMHKHQATGPLSTLKGFTGATFALRAHSLAEAS